MMRLTPATIKLMASLKQVTFHDNSARKEPRRWNKTEPRLSRARTTLERNLAVMSMYYEDHESPEAICNIVGISMRNFQNIVYRMRKEYNDRYKKKTPGPKKGGKNGKSSATV